MPTACLASHSLLVLICVFETVSPSGVQAGLRTRSPSGWAYRFLDYNPVPLIMHSLKVKILTFQVLELQGVLLCWLRTP
jgi:hypothetical protein